MHQVGRLDEESDAAVVQAGASVQPGATLVDVAIVAQRGGRWALFQALQNENLRHIWLGQLGQSTSLRVETVARSWLVRQLTGSATALATVSLLRSLSLIIFGMMSGVAAERMG